MVLFLDFDGVLHPFDRPDGVFTLLADFERAIRDYPEIDIVISSAWREPHGLDELRRLFSPDIAQRIVGATPVFTDFTRPHLRESEIIAWLHDAGRQEEAWVAIDDTDWFFSANCANLILVDPGTGFNSSTEQELRRRLSG